MEDFKRAGCLLGDGEGKRLAGEDAGEDRFRARQHMLQVALNARAS